MVKNFNSLNANYRWKDLMKEREEVRFERIANLSIDSYYLETIPRVFVECFGNFKARKLMPQKNRSKSEDNNYHTIDINCTGEVEIYQVNMVAPTEMNVAGSEVSTSNSTGLFVDWTLRKIASNFYFLKLSTL